MKDKYLEYTQRATLWAIIFASISINLPTAFMSVALVLLMFFWAISGDYKVKFEHICANPAALVAIALFALYALGTLYSSAPWGGRLGFLMKYQKLLFIPIIVSVLYSEKYRRYAINAFLITMMAVLVISYFKWLGLVPHHDLTDQGYFVFKGRIAQSIFMSFAMYLMMYRALKSKGAIRYTWLLFGILAALNILFLVNGRTGQITMIALIVWFTFELWGVKSFKYWFGIILLGIFLHQAVTNLPSSRLMDIQQEIADHQANGTQTSAGQRLEMYKNTISLIKKHPLFGGGTGSLENEYEELAKNNKLELTRVPNPHNQFLLTLQEIGIFGFLMLALMWIVHWKVSYRMNIFQDGFALRGLILTIFIGSLFNSLLLDAGEGKFYCVLAGVLLSGYKSNEHSSDA